ncbi:hypothetical protein KAH37_03890 [bacterium]|nr:hypothetical protein [bacterium]
MSGFRLTGEKLLKYIAILVGLIFFLFTVITVFVELRKPTDPIEKIIHEQCETLTQFGVGNFDATLTRAIDSFTLDALESDSSQCQLVILPSAQTGDVQHLLNRKPVAKRGYIYLSDRVVLLKNLQRNLRPYAEALYSCVRRNECDTSSLEESRDMILFTATFFGKSRKPVVSITFSEFAFSDAIKRANTLLHAMLKTKDKDADLLEFRVYFHGRYTQLGSKKQVWVEKRFNRGKDGFYLKSRGAKLRAMPWEMKGKTLFRSIKKKARQYGLKKDELEQDSATLYLFSTTIFRENDGKLEVSDG